MSEIEGAATGHRHGVQLFLALPHLLLERILMKAGVGMYKSSRRNLTLRLTCKCFRDAVDGSLVSHRLQYIEHDEAKVCLEGFLKRVRHPCSFKTLCLDAVHVWKPAFSVKRLMWHLPNHLTTLVIYGDVSSLRPLKWLKSLKTLVMEDQERTHAVQEITYITGLTRLDCCNPVGFLAHLAPTLEHLCINEFEDVSDLKRLTKLKVLDVKDDLFPNDFFKNHSTFQLNHLGLRRSSIGNIMSLPSTLTCLTVYGYGGATLAELPQSITRLQILYARREDIPQVASVLPGLKALDLSFKVDWRRRWNHALDHLSKLTNLQSMRMHVHDDPNYRGEWFRGTKGKANSSDGFHSYYDSGDDDDHDSSEDNSAADSYSTTTYNSDCYQEVWSEWQVLRRLPCIAAAMKRGVQLEVIDEERSRLAWWKGCDVGTSWVDDV